MSRFPGDFMSMRKSIFITGAASGIGLATAKLFAKKGWFVGLADINAAGLKAALDAIGRENGATYLLDVRDRAAWDDALSVFTTAAGGKLDVLLNNAGVVAGGYFDELSEADIDRQLDINLKGVINGARAGVRHLKQNAGSQLVNVASCAALFGVAGSSIYSATKFAVRGLSQSLQAEFARFGVGVKCIMPWFIDTPILAINTPGTNEKLTDTLRASGIKIYPVEDCAEVIWNAVHSSALEHIVGGRGKQLAWLIRLMPGLIRRQSRALSIAGRAPGS
jgi:NAD(P)-dependent dehydrogenase (short-subunit alcohol dehydrogenase family)